MKKKRINNIGVKILSVAIAFVLWVVIINIEDPTTSRTFRVKVEIQNDDIVASSGQVYKIEEGEYVDVTVKGNKSYVDSLTENDIMATADFRYLSNYGSVPITAKCTKYTNTKYTVELGSADHVLVELEDVSQNKFIVRFNVVSQPPDGYYVDTNLITSNPTKVTITGGESIVNNISSVEVDIDASNQTNDFSETLKPKIYDNAGNIIASSNIKCSVDKVTVNVKVLETKNVPINVTLVGNPAYGYKAEPVIYDPTEVTIAGRKDKLDSMKSIELSVNIDGANKNAEQVVDLTDGILPEGIYLEDNRTTVNIEVPVSALESKEITFNASDIAVKMPAGSFTYQFENPAQEYKVQVFALSDEINDVTIDTLKPSIDLTDKSFGSYTVKIEFSDYYLVEPIGSIKAKVSLKNPNTTPEEGDDGSNSITPTPIPTQADEDNSQSANGNVAVPTTTEIPSNSPTVSNEPVVPNGTSSNEEENNQ